MPQELKIVTTITRGKMHALCGVHPRRRAALSVWIVLAVVKALHRGLGNCLKICGLADPVPLTFWTQNRQTSTDCRGLLLCQVSSHSDQGFSFCRANIPMHPHTRIHTHRDKVIEIQLPFTWCSFVIRDDGRGPDHVTRWRSVDVTGRWCRTVLFYGCWCCCGPCQRSMTVTRSRCCRDGTADAGPTALTNDIIYFIYLTVAQTD